MIPPLLNDFIGLQKDTGPRVVHRGRRDLPPAQIEQPATFNFTPYLVVGARVHRGHHPAGAAHRLAGRARRGAAPPRPARRSGDAPPRRRRDRGDAVGAAGRPRCLRSRACTSRSATLEVLRGIDLEVAEHEVVVPDRRLGLAASRRCCAASTCWSRSTPAGSSSRARRSPPGVDVDRIRRRIGIVFQAYNLFPHMSVLDNVTLAPRKVLEAAAGGGRGRGDARCSSGSASPTSGATSRTACPAASSSGWRSSGRSRCSPTCCCSTRSRRALDPELVAEVLDVIRELARSGHDDGHRHPRDGLRPRHRQPGLLPRRRPDPRGRAAGADLRRAARGADAAVPRSGSSRPAGCSPAGRRAGAAG